LKMSPKKFHVKGAGKAPRWARKGTSIRFSLSEPATVSFKIKSKGKPLHKGGKFTRSLGVGANSVPFKGKAGKTTLKPGKYVLTLVATDFAKHKSSPVKVSFTILA